MNDEHMQIDSFAPVIEMDVLANGGSEQYSSPMQDDYSEDEDSFAGIVLLYLYEPSDSQASSNSSSSEDSELSSERLLNFNWYEHK